MARICAENVLGILEAMEHAIAAMERVPFEQAAPAGIYLALGELKGQHRYLLSYAVAPVEIETLEDAA